MKHHRRVAHHVSTLVLIDIDTIMISNVEIDIVIQVRAIEIVTKTDAVADHLNDGGCITKINGVVCIHVRDQECKDIRIHIERKDIKIVQEIAMITVIVARIMVVDGIPLTDNLVPNSNHKITVLDKIIVGHLVTIHKVLVTVVAIVVATIQKAISNRMVAVKVILVAVAVNILKVIANQVIVTTLIANMMAVIVANLRTKTTTVVDFPVILVTELARVIAPLIAIHITGVVKL